MPTNPFFNLRHSLAEQSLLEDLMVETVQQFGIDMIYMPRTLVDEDKIWGEDANSQFNEGYSIEVYMDNPREGFGGDNDFLAKFGLEIRDRIEFTMSKRRFAELQTGQSRPFEGDLLYFPLSKGIFEIMFVEHEQPFYQLGRLHTYKLSCELFQYSQEQFETGDVDIDKISSDLDNSNDVSNDAYADNEEIEDEADDQTESNVFGNW